MKDQQDPKLVPVIVGGQPLFTFCVTYTQGTRIESTYGCIRADTLEEAEAQALIAGRKDNPEGQYVFHGIKQVAF